ncbi:MAG: hypothetical protein J6Y24_13460, partial [Bacteroidales bacterium]|nr:hypothetical protein [Bacteroidales bacterium]
MKKLILLSFLLLGWLSNYAQPYKVTIHKPEDIPLDSILMEKSQTEPWLQPYYRIATASNKILCTIYIINGKYTYQEIREISDVSDNTFWIDEEPKTLSYYVYSYVPHFDGGILPLFDIVDKKEYYRIQQWIEEDDIITSGYQLREETIPFTSNSITTEDGMYYLLTPHGFDHYKAKVTVSYESFKSNCKKTDNFICRDEILNFTNTIAVPYPADIYVATEDNPNQKYILDIKLPKKATSFSIPAQIIFDSIGYNKPFDIYLLFKVKLMPWCEHKIHFKGINYPVSYDSIYIKDHYLIITNTENNKNCSFVLSGKTISQDFNPNTKFIPTGQYQLQISDKNDNYCQVNLDAYVPEIEYNYLDTTRKEFTHWHSEDTTQAINLKIYNVNNN